MSSSRISYAESFDDALDTLSEVELRDDYDMVPLRGVMASLEEGYDLDKEGSVPENEYVPSFYEVLEWGGEKGPMQDSTCVVSYGGRDIHLDHCRNALEKVPDRLDDWSVEESLQSLTRPVLLVYDPELLDFGVSFHAELPLDEELRDDLIQYAVVLDKDPSNREFTV